jgi:HAD superfamily hydrolase (TIGR01509 family)
MKKGCDKVIKAVLFDFDGLILDTETQEYRALQEMFQEHGSELPLQVWAECIGTHADFFDPVTYLEEQLGKTIDRESFIKRRRERTTTLLQHEKALPGVEAYLTAAKDLGLKIGLASSSKYEWVSNHLKNLALFDAFQCIRTANDVEKVKPDPSLFLEAAKCLGVNPEECIVFEDSANGALAAKRAGMYCVIVPNKVTKGLAFGEVDHRLESLAEADLAYLIEQLTKQDNK